MRPLHRLLVAVLAALVGAFALALAAAPVRAQVDSLQGETFAATFVRITASCDPLGTSTIAFRAEGDAFGPYSGTFVEEGTATLPGGSVQRLLSFESTFTIFDLTGEVVVTGTKTLGLDAAGTCVDAQNVNGIVIGIFAVVTYEATIRAETGTFRDTGDANVRLTGLTCDPECEQGFFTESFTLSRSLLPVFTSGKATGGGQFLDAMSLERVTFGFEVKSTEDPDRLQGRCLVLDQASETKVKCLDVTDYEELGNTATWGGTAEVNGVREDYRITVQDNGEPNQGIDMFSIDTQRYDAAGPVQHGNVQLHKHKLAP